MGKGANPDILVIGAGIFGLSCAWACAARGLSVLVAEASRPGAGSSGGPTGALSPHPPEKWNAKKALQLTTLLDAERHWAEIAATGGIDPGYGRTGRLIPLGTEGERRRAEAQALHARTLWPAPLSWQIIDTPFLLAPFGTVHETLSARVDPPRAIAALVAALTARGVEIRADLPATGLEPGAARFGAQRIAAGAVILAGGYDGFALMEPALGFNPGQGVKGQALRLRPRLPIGPELIYAEGLYIVPHADGSVGVGSTSEGDWTEAHSIDTQLDALLVRARTICPALEGAEILTRWAGIRPRGARPEPMLGEIPGLRRVFVAGAGFRTGFGQAPAVGDALAAMVTGATPDLPPGFQLADHLPKSDI